MGPEKKKQNSLSPRPPVVVILGHVDHGKSSILEKIKDLKITEKESGGITQHIGAYQIEHKDKKITFIDTPGHEAFSAMRSRGAQVADVAILVVAAEEGVKPQTKEAIKHIKKTDIPCIVAINKTDKPEAQPERIKTELSENGLIVESLGGEIPSVNVSAKNGHGLDDLLEMISLIAEMEEFKGNYQGKAKGVIIEARRDDRRGTTATVLIKDGLLKSNNIVGTNSAVGKIKTMEDFQLNSIQEAGPSTPTVITGFNDVPKVGEQIYSFDSLEEAQAKTEEGFPEKEKAPAEKAEPSSEETEKKILNLILKADVQGSLEAITESLKAIPDDEVSLKILKSEAGEINESDIKLAESGNARIVGFRIKIPSPIRQIAQNRKVKIVTFDIIYELIQEIRGWVAKLLEPEIIRTDLGQLKTLAVFKTEKDRQIVGGRMVKGTIKKGALAEIVREGRKIGKGKIIGLQRDKKETDEVKKDQECGILFKGDAAIEKGDALLIYQEEKKKREI